MEPALQGKQRTKDRGLDAATVTLGQGPEGSPSHSQDVRLRTMSLLLLLFPLSSLHLQVTSVRQHQRTGQRDLVSLTIEGSEPYYCITLSLKIQYTFVSALAIKSEGSNKLLANKGQGLVCQLALITIHRLSITQQRPQYLCVLFISWIISQAAELPFTIAAL